MALASCLGSQAAGCACVKPDGSFRVIRSLTHLVTENSRKPLAQQYRLTAQPQTELSKSLS